MSRTAAQNSEYSWWFNSKCFSYYHFLIILAFGFLVGISFYDKVTLLVSYGIFFAVTALPRIWRLVIIGLLVSGVTILFPPLAPIIAVLMVVFFFLKVGYIIRNWRPIVAGLLVYGAAVPLLLIEDYYYGKLPLMMGIVGLLGMHFLLNWLYNYGYTPESALAIMGGVPVVIITLLLPFLQLNFDLGDFFDAPDISHQGVNNYSYDSPVEVEGDMVVDNNDNPGAHYVEGYRRDDGTYVEGYWRTDPDGIEENNYSYDE